MNRTTRTTIFILPLLLLVLQSCFHQPLVQANPYGSDMTPAPTMPSIIIDNKGNIHPKNTSIQKNGKLYILTGNINDYSIEINCNDIILNGAGFTLAAQNQTYAPSSAITIHSKRVEIQNMNLLQFKSASVLVLGSNNKIAQNTINGLGSGIELHGNYNNVINNTIHDGGITLGGNYNNIIGNLLTKHGIFMIGSIREAPSEIIPNFTMIVGNTIKDCRGVTFGVYLTYGIHFFYLNNFINNENGNISPVRWQLATKRTTDSCWEEIYPEDTIFDNGRLGNYWSDFKGIDANQDGIGDTSYEIGGILKDRYPLTAPVDSDNIPIELPEWTSILSASTPTRSPTSTPNPSPTLEPKQTPTGEQTLTTIPTSEQALQLPSSIEITIVAVALLLSFGLFAAIVKRRSKPK